MIGYAPVLEKIMKTDKELCIAVAEKLGKHDMGEGKLSLYYCCTHGYMHPRTYGLSVAKENGTAVTIDKYLNTKAWEILRRDGS